MKAEPLLQRPPDLSFHHPSHRHLLDHVPVEEAVGAHIDAVIVPTSRPVSWLREAMGLARELGATLVVMCSRRVTASEVVQLAEAEGVKALAVDVAGAAGALPTFATSELLVGTVFERDSDVSIKRNLALLLGRMAGWERVLFLDDDIFDVKDAEVAAGLLGTYAAVGLPNAGFPDNSVVCHIHRETGGVQDQFIGAGALAVAPALTQSFFPDVYNTDWFFLLGGGQPPRAAVTGSMRQKTYDPFADPDRARREELGDCLAEGLYWLLDHQRPLEHADTDHWREFIVRRTYFIEHLLSQVRTPDGPVGNRARWRASLDVARNACANVTPSLCAEYVTTWQADLETWQKFVADLPGGRGVAEALKQLGLSHRAAGTKGLLDGPSKID